MTKVFEKTLTSVMAENVKEAYGHRDTVAKARIAHGRTVEALKAR
jgi:hypothetical protein